MSKKDSRLYYISNVNIPGRLFRAVINNPFAAIATAIIFVVIVIVVFGPILAIHDPIKTDLSFRFASPCMQYPLGNDALGRCFFSRILCGARTSIGLGIVIVLFSCSFGVTIGLVSGYMGGMFDEALMRIVDIFFSFPEIVAAMAVAGILGPGIINLLLALSAVSWMRYARLVRGITLSVKEKDYVKAAKLSGVSRTAILFRHILPANHSSIIVLASIGLAKAVLGVSALGFLGFGIQPPHPEWGTLLMEGKDYILSEPRLSLYPGIAIMLSVLSFNILGDWLKVHFTK